ncbi:MAG: hypothetical protein WDW38_006800 [Sanguina aurantia]
MKRATDRYRWIDSERASLLHCEMTVMCVLNFPDSQRHPFVTACTAMSALGVRDFTQSPVNTLMNLILESINHSHLTTLCLQYSHETLGLAAMWLSLKKIATHSPTFRLLLPEGATFCGHFHIQLSVLQDIESQMFPDLLLGTGPFCPDTPPKHSNLPAPFERSPTAEPAPPAPANNISTLAGDHPPESARPATATLGTGSHSVAFATSASPGQHQSTAAAAAAAPPPHVHAASRSAAVTITAAVTTDTATLTLPRSLEMPSSVPPSVPLHASAARGGAAYTPCVQVWRDSSHAAHARPSLATLTCSPRIHGGSSSSGGNRRDIFSACRREAERPSARLPARTWAATTTRSNPSAHGGGEWLGISCSSSQDGERSSPAVQRIGRGSIAAQGVCTAAAQDYKSTDIAPRCEPQRRKPEAVCPAAATQVPTASQMVSHVAAPGIAPSVAAPSAAVAAAAEAVAAPSVDATCRLTHTLREKSLRAAPQAGSESGVFTMGQVSAGSSSRPQAGKPSPVRTAAAFEDEAKAPWVAGMPRWNNPRWQSAYAVTWKAVRQVSRGWWREGDAASQGAADSKAGQKRRPASVTTAAANTAKPNLDAHAHSGSATAAAATAVAATPVNESEASEPAPVERPTSKRTRGDGLVEDGGRDEPAVTERPALHLRGPSVAVLHADEEHALARMPYDAFVSSLLSGTHRQLLSFPPTSPGVLVLQVT